MANSDGVTDPKAKEPPRGAALLEHPYLWVAVAASAVHFTILVRALLVGLALALRVLIELIASSALLSMGSALLSAWIALLTLPILLSFLCHGVGPPVRMELNSSIDRAR
jgi:hypothetical protein